MRNLVRYNPNSMRVYGDFDHLVDAFFHETSFGKKIYPRVDVREDGERYTLEAELPGLTEKDIEVTVENNLLTISSVSAKDVKDGDNDYVLHERRHQSFSRSFVLPKDVDPAKTEAGLSNGLLTLSIDKRPEMKTKTIEIKGK